MLNGLCKCPLAGLFAKRMPGLLCWPRLAGRGVKGCSEVLPTGRRPRSLVVVTRLNWVNEVLLLQDV